MARNLLEPQHVFYFQQDFLLLGSKLQGHLDKVINCKMLGNLDINYWSIFWILRLLAVKSETTLDQDAFGNYAETL